MARQAGLQFSSLKKVRKVSYFRLKHPLSPLKVGLFFLSSFVGLKCEVVARVLLYH